MLDGRKSSKQYCNLENHPNMQYVKILQIYCEMPVSIQAIACHFDSFEEFSSCACVPLQLYHIHTELSRYVYVSKYKQIWKGQFNSDKTEVYFIYLFWFLYTFKYTLIAHGVVITGKKAYFCELSHCMLSIVKNKEVGQPADSLNNLGFCLVS